MLINLKEMICILAHNDPREVYEDMLKNNEEFKRFIERNVNKDTNDMIQYYLYNKDIRDISQA